jgi:hypothetical protein
MSLEERLVADYSGTGLTVGKHPMVYRRAALRAQNVLSAEELRERRDGEYVRTAGCVIARQRPGTAKGFVFLSMEDETGIANVIVTPSAPAAAGGQRRRGAFPRLSLGLFWGRNPPLSRLPPEGAPQFRTATIGLWERPAAGYFGFPFSRLEIPPG